MTIRSVWLEVNHEVLVILGGSWNYRFTGNLTQRALQNGELGINMLVLIDNHFEILFKSDNSSATNGGFEVSYEPTFGAPLIIYEYLIYQLFKPFICRSNNLKAG